MSAPGVVHVIGGSNCLIGNGWVAQWQAMMSDTAVVNLAVGGATSLVGLYRILADEVPHGATVIWEYALNEQAHLVSGQSLSSLIGNLSWFLEICARRDIRVLPLIFWTRPELRPEARRDYREAMFALLSERGLAAVDMRPVLAEFSAKRDREPASFYSDPQHYRLGSGFPRRIATAVRNRIGQARVPRPDPALAGRSLHLLRPDRPADERFENRVIRSDLFMTDRPVTLDADGRVICAYVLAAEGGQPMRVTMDGRRRGDFSMQFPAEGRALKRLMKHLVLSEPGAAPVRQVTFERVAGAGRIIAQNSFAPHDPARTGLREGLIGILVER